MTEISGVAAEESTAGSGAHGAGGGMAPPPCRESFGRGGLDDLLMGDDLPSRANGGGFGMSSSGGLGRSAGIARLSAKSSGAGDGALLPHAVVSGPGKLRDAWKFGNVIKNAGWMPEQFGSTMKSAEDLWQHLNAMKLPSAVGGEASPYLFKDGTQPKWESPIFQKEGSGRVGIHIVDRQHAEKLFDCCWLYSILSILGGDGFAAGHETAIVGIASTLRQPPRGMSSSRLDIWVSANHLTEGTEIRDAFERDFWANIEVLEKLLGEDPSLRVLFPIQSNAVKLDFKIFEIQTGGHRRR